jgi:hypothetical protein
MVPAVDGWKVLDRKGVPVSALVVAAAPLVILWHLSVNGGVMARGLT